MGLSSGIDKTGVWKRGDPGRCLFHLSMAPDPCTQILTKTVERTKLKG